MGKRDRQALMKLLERKQTFQNDRNLTSMIVYGGSIRSIIQQHTIILSLGNGSVHHSRLGAAYDTGY